MEIKIQRERLIELELAQAKLDALEAGGVENWDFYADAMQELNKSLERTNALHTCLEELEVCFLDGAYEPSERGAGFCSKDSSREEAERVLNQFVRKWYQSKS